MYIVFVEEDNSITEIKSSLIKLLKPVHATPTTDYNTLAVFEAFYLQYAFY